MPNQVEKQVSCSKSRYGTWFEMVELGESMGEFDGKNVDALCDFLLRTTSIAAARRHFDDLQQGKPLAVCRGISASPSEVFSEIHYLLKQAGADKSILDPTGQKTSADIDDELWRLKTNLSRSSNDRSRG